MIQQGQVFRLKSSRDGEFSSENDAIEALELELERARRTQRISRQLTLAELAHEYLAQHDEVAPRDDPSVLPSSPTWRTLAHTFSLDVDRAEGPIEAEVVGALEGAGDQERCAEAEPEHRPRREPSRV